MGLCALERDIVVEAVVLPLFLGEGEEEDVVELEGERSGDADPVPERAPLAVARSRVADGEPLSESEPELRGDPVAAASLRVVVMEVVGEFEEEAVRAAPVKDGELDTELLRVAATLSDKPLLVMEIVALKLFAAERVAMEAVTEGVVEAGAEGRAATETEVDFDGEVLAEAQVDALRVRPLPVREEDPVTEKERGKEPEGRAEAEEVTEGRMPRLRRGRGAAAR